MSTIEVDKIIPQSGTDTQLGESGDTITIPAGATITNNGTASGFDTDTNDKVKVSTNDTTPGFLNGKLVAGTNISLTEGSDGGNETLTAALSGTITPSDNTVTLAKMAPGTDGNIISYDASGNPVAVATGNDGQVLTSAGAGAPPVFEDVAAGGAFTLLKTIDASTASTVEFIDGASGVVLDGTYNNYVVRGTGVLMSTTAGVVMRLREGSSFISSTDYDTVSYAQYGTQTAIVATGSTGSAYIRGSWQRYSNSTAGFSTNFEAKFYNLPSTSLFKQVYYSGCNTGNDANDFTLNHAAGLLDRSGSRTSACTGIQFLATSGTLSGKFSLYGVTT